MFTRIQLLSLVLAVVPWTIAPIAEAATDFSGRVVAAADNQLVLTADTTQQTFVVGKDTSITLNGEAATMQDIVSGFKAIVLAEPREARWVAKTIVVYTAR